MCEKQATQAYCLARWEQLPVATSMVKIGALIDGCIDIGVANPEE
jgi:hypothetical protein